MYHRDREIFAVKIISRLRPTAKFNTRIKHLRGDYQPARTSTPTEVNVRSTTTPDSYSVTASDSWLSR